MLKKTAKRYKTLIILKNTNHLRKKTQNFYNVDILNSFNPELQLKDTESAVRSKLIDLLCELRGFKFVTTLVIEFNIQRSGQFIILKILSSFRGRFL